MGRRCIHSRFIFYLIFVKYKQINYLYDNGINNISPSKMTNKDILLKMKNKIKEYLLCGALTDFALSFIETPSVLFLDKFMEI